MRITQISLLFILLVTLSACLKFGDDVELSGAEINQDIFNKVTTATGISFPPGTVGKEYLYYGSGIDPALAIKVAIPKSEKETFLSNAIFTEGLDKVPSVQLGKNKIWWKMDSLAQPVHREFDHQSGDRIEVSAGEENEEFIAYVSWITF